MRDKDAIMHSIRTEPEEDMHRLGYADCIEEEGNPARAHFIRMQCELSRLGAHPRGHANIVRKEKLEKDLKTLYRKNTLLQLELCGEVNALNPRNGFLTFDLPAKLEVLTTVFPRGFLDTAYLSTGNLRIGGYHTSFDREIDNLNATKQPITILHLSASQYQPTREDIERIRLPSLRKVEGNYDEFWNSVTHAASMQQVQKVEISSLPGHFSPQNMRNLCNRALMRPTHILLSYPQGLPDTALRYLVASPMAQKAVIEIAEPTEAVKAGLTRPTILALDSHNRAAARESGEKYTPRPWMRSFLPANLHRGMNTAPIAR